MIVGDGAGFDYLVYVLVNLNLNVVKFLHRFQYGLYVIILLDTVYLNLCFLTRSPMKKYSWLPNLFTTTTFLNDTKMINLTSQMAIQTHF
jgi:hypothetical protein